MLKTFINALSSYLYAKTKSRRASERTCESHNQRRKLFAERDSLFSVERVGERMVFRGFVVGKETEAKSK